MATNSVVVVEKLHVVRLKSADSSMFITLCVQIW
jgi:hypothetical protein